MIFYFNRNVANPLINIFSQLYHNLLSLLVPKEELPMENKKHMALIGDVGGTNIRLQLIAIDMDSPEPTILKEKKYQVKEHDVFQKAIELFL